MACKGLSADYLCEGWRTRAAAIRVRDGERCRGCGRGASEVRLEVHHRLYGTPGACGACVLTGVADEDLITLCVDCHEAVTSVRRRVRYADRPVEPLVVPAPDDARVVARVRVEIEAEAISNPVAVRFVPARRFEI